MRLLIFFIFLTTLSTVLSHAFLRSFTPLKITFDVVSRRKIPRTTAAPVIKRIVSSQRKKESSSTIEKQTFSNPESPFFPKPNDRFTSGNLVEQAQAQSEFTILILKSFKGNNIAAQYIDPIFATSDCLNNLEDVSKLIEQGTQLIVDNSAEIIYLEAIVEDLKDEKDIVKLLKASAKMLRTLDSFAPGLASSSASLCISSPQDSVTAFKDLARVLGEISRNRKLDVPPRSRQLLAFSSNVMSETAYFLQVLNESIESFKNECETSSKNHSLVYRSIGDIMASLASLFDSIGFEDKSAEIRKMAEFLKKVVEVFDDIEDLDTTLDCSFDASYTSLASVLDDLVEIVDSVGIETLAAELGINLDFINRL